MVIRCYNRISLTLNTHNIKAADFAADVGVTCSDTGKSLQASVVVKNMGSQLKHIVEVVVGKTSPFDLQAGGLKQQLKLHCKRHTTCIASTLINDTAFLLKKVSLEIKILRL